MNNIFYLYSVTNGEKEFPLVTSLEDYNNNPTIEIVIKTNIIGRIIEEVEKADFKLIKNTK